LYKRNEMYIWKTFAIKTLILDNQAILKNEYFISSNCFHFFWKSNRHVIHTVLTMKTSYFRNIVWQLHHEKGFSGTRYQTIVHKDIVSNIACDFINITSEWKKWMKYYYQVYCLHNIFSITIIIKLTIIMQL